MDPEVEENSGPEQARLEWKDGRPFSARFDDIYFSLEDGPRETRHVFLRNNDLARRFRGGERLGTSTPFNICELGFGTGLNFLLTRRLFLRLAPVGQRLNFISLEKYPPRSTDMTRALAPVTRTGMDAGEFAERMPPPVEGFHRLSFDDERVILLLYYGDVERGLADLSLSREPSGRIHAWYLDGFAPARNPEMWTPTVFAHMARLSAPGTTLATFTAAAVAREGLSEAGFRVEKVRGFGRKRDMLRGIMETPLSRTKTGIPANDKRSLRAPWYARGVVEHGVDADESHVLVVGAGLAGSNAARALARRGKKVTVLEQGDAPAAGASGTAAGIILPVLSARPSHFSRYSAAAYLHLLRFLRTGHTRGELWDQPGLIQLFSNNANRERLEKSLANLELPETFVRGVDRTQASELAGMETASGGLYFPEGAWVDTPALCRANLEHENIQLITGRKAMSIQRENQGWSARDASSKIIAHAPVMILAAAMDTIRFAPTAWLPLVSVRGQLFSMPSTAHSRRLRAIVCYDGYVLPDRRGHVVGATFELENQNPAAQPELNQGLYQALARNVPGMGAAFAHAIGEGDEASAYFRSLPARAAFRAATRDRFPIIGPVPDHNAFTRAYTDIAVRSHRTRDTYGEDYPAAPLLPGLYVSTGHGSRGLIYSCLGAEYLASLITGEPSPVSRDIAEALHPARFLVRKLKTGPVAPME